MEDKKAALPIHHQDDFKQNVCSYEAVEHLSGGMKLRRLASVMLILLPCLFVCLGGVPVSTKPRLQLFKVQQHRASGAWSVRVGKLQNYIMTIICKGIQGVFWNEKNL